MDRIRVKEDPDASVLRAPAAAASDVEPCCSRPTDVSSRDATRRDDNCGPADSLGGHKVAGAPPKSVNGATASPSAIRHVSGTTAADVEPAVCSQSMNGRRCSLSPPELICGPAPETTSSGHTKKLRRLLSVLLHFGRQVSDDLADRVKHLILALVSGCLSVDEFHSSLNDLAHSPLRPFVVPFLRTHLPALQRELLTLARAAKQTLPQYVWQHELLVFDESGGNCDCSEVFSAQAHDLRKRTHSDSQFEGVRSDSAFSSVAKRPSLCPGPGRQSLSHGPGARSPPAAVSGARTYSRSEESPGDEDDEWRDIHVMLNCILGMVEQTRRALSILQTRCGRSSCSGTDPASWSQALPTGEVQRHAVDLLTQTVRATEERVAEIRRHAEESVNEVKQQALRDLRRAVSAAEFRATELLAEERVTRLDCPPHQSGHNLHHAHHHHQQQHAHHQQQQHTTQDPRAPTTTRATPTLAPVAPVNGTEAARQYSSAENCWNCGRRASETCSGCGLARYCGAFCQHKDWQLHRTRCGQVPLGGSGTPTTGGGDLRLSVRTAQPPPVVSTPSQESKD